MDVGGQVALRFTGGVHTGAHVNLTAVRAAGQHLWTAGDETPTLERLVLDSPTHPTRAGRQRTFRLADLVQLPGTASGEADVQGIAGDGGWLWVIGSHSLVRRRPKPEHDEAKVLRRLGKLRHDPNRYVVVRVAMQPGIDRHPEPVRVARDGRRSALIGAPHAETLVDLLRADRHLAPFLAIPVVDNGFGVQGLAVVGDRLYVGLRGPVLRGWAVVLEVLPVQDPTDPGRLALGIFPEGTRYRKHFLDLGGLGVRDLCPDGDDLLVLAGPTMTASGQVRVHRWLGAAAAPSAPVVREADLPVQTRVAHGDGDDHPAAFTLLTPDAPERAALLVVYAAPSPARRPWPDTVLADVLEIGPKEPGTELDDEVDDDELDDAAYDEDVDLLEATAEAEQVDDDEPGPVATEEPALDETDGDESRAEEFDGLAPGGGTDGGTDGAAEPDPTLGDPDEPPAPPEPPNAAGPR